MQRKEYTGSCDHSLYFVAAYINRLQQFGVNVVSVTGLCLQVLKYTLAQYVRLSISIFNQRKKKNFDLFSIDHHKIFSNPDNYYCLNILKFYFSK